MPAVFVPPLPPNHNVTPQVRVDRPVVALAQPNRQLPTQTRQAIAQVAQGQSGKAAHGQTDRHRGRAPGEQDRGGWVDIPV